MADKKIQHSKLSQIERSVIFRSWLYLVVSVFYHYRLYGMWNLIIEVIFKLEAKVDPLAVWVQFNKKKILESCWFQLKFWNKNRNDSAPVLTFFKVKSRFFKNRELCWSNLPQNSNCGRELVQKSGVQIPVGEGQKKFVLFSFDFYILHKKLNIDA